MALALRAGRVAAPRIYQRSRMTCVSVRAYQPDGPADVPAQKAKGDRPQIKMGDKVPMEEKVWVWKDGKDTPEEVTIGSALKGKRAVVFGLPGAYTSVCSSKHVPEYQSKLQDLRNAGVEVLACASVNDAYVMHFWAKSLGVDTNQIMMLGDADASFHEALGLTQTLPGLGVRARRYSMYLEDGEVKVLNIEEPGGKSYKVSGPSHMLEDLRKLKGGN